MTTPTDFTDEVKKAAKSAADAGAKIISNAAQQTRKVLENPAQGLQESFDAINNSPIGYRGLAKKTGLLRD